MAIHDRFTKNLGGSVSTIIRRSLGETNPPCGSCNACCKHYEVRYEEGDDLSLFTAIGKDGVPALPRSEDHVCAYLIEEKCSVYDRRPMSCRKYDCRTLAISGSRLGGELRSAKGINAAINAWDVLSGVKTEEDIVYVVKMVASARLFSELGFGGQDDRVPDRKTFDIVRRAVSNPPKITLEELTASVELSKPLWLSTEMEGEGVKNSAATFHTKDPR